MLDQNGYLELILYPSPLSFFTTLLVPFIRNKPLFRRLSHRMSIAIFWFENVFFLGGMMVQLALLIPYNYCVTTFQILRLTLTLGQSSDGPRPPFEVSSRHMLPYFLTMLYLLPLWLVMGPPFLLLAFFKDLFYIG